MKNLSISGRSNLAKSILMHRTTTQAYARMGIKFPMIKRINRESSMRYLM